MEERLTPGFCPPELPRLCVLLMAGNNLHVAQTNGLPS
jgi:hypothetical protein